MNVSDLKLEISRIFKLDGTGATKAFVDLSVADAFVIKGLRLIEGSQGLFVTMPQSAGKDSKWYSIVVPISKEVKDEVDRLVFEAYKT